MQGKKKVLFLMYGRTHQTMPSDQSGTEALTDVFFGWFLFWNRFRCFERHDTLLCYMENYV